VAQSRYHKAFGRSREAVIAAIFRLKTRAHWKEAQPTASRLQNVQITSQTQVRPDIIALQRIASSPKALSGMWIQGIWESGELQKQRYIAP